MVDMDNDSDILAAFVHQPGRKLLLASTAGNGFIVPEAEVIANTRKGKQVMNVDTAGRGAAVRFHGRRRRPRRHRRREPQAAGFPAGASCPK